MKRGEQEREGEAAGVVVRDARASRKISWKKTTKFQRKRFFRIKWRNSSKR